MSARRWTSASAFCSTYCSALDSRRRTEPDGLRRPLPLTTTTRTCCEDTERTPACTVVERSEVVKCLWVSLFMAALCNRARHYIFALWFLLSICLFSSPNLSRRRLDVYHTSTHGVSLVRIQDAGLKRAARGSLKIEDAKNCQKIAILAPSHNFVRLYLRN